jgi:copper oxidase (laccase) domain-containing protein
MASATVTSPAPAGSPKASISGLNIGVGSDDDPTRVAENRRRVASWMGVPADHLLSLYQVHSPDVVVATGPFADGRPKADAS